jgi:hypothetical protein
MTFHKRITKLKKTKKRQTIAQVIKGIGSILFLKNGLKKKLQKKI